MNSFWSSLWVWVHWVNLVLLPLACTMHSIISTIPFKIHIILNIFYRFSDFFIQLLFYPYLFTFQVFSECAPHYSPLSRCFSTVVKWCICFKMKSVFQSVFRYQSVLLYKSVFIYDFQHTHLAKTCGRKDILLWCKYNIWQLLKNISKAMKNVVDIEIRLRKLIILVLI